MAREKSYTVELVSDLRCTRRGLAFLLCENDPSINAKSVFDGLPLKQERLLRTRFDHWLDGQVHDKYFHGWNRPGYRDCFVFKWSEKSRHHRLYGFLCNPLSLVRGFQLCVLVSHAVKNTWETDPSELNGAEALRRDRAVMEAISRLEEEMDPLLR